MNLLSLVGWESLTPQGIRFGIATMLALLALTPNRSSGGEVFINMIFSVGASILVAQAVSLGR